MKKKLIYLLIGIIVITGLIIYLGSRPSVGKIKKTNAGERKIEPVKILKYETENIGFEYLNNYLVENIESTDEALVENIHLLGKPGVMSEFVITLKKDMAKSVEEMSGVKMRQLNSDVYEEMEITWKDNVGILFQKIDGFELTAFFLKNGKSMTVAMRANTNDVGKYREEFDKLLGSIEWTRGESNP